STPEKYLETMWLLFDDIKLKLKNIGNCFVNLGDTYTGSGNGYGSIDPKNRTLCESGGNEKPPKYNALPSKCLLMIPQRFAWGMIERGWILRNEIIWHKPNHMPEPVTDRLTKSHEVIWHFVKQQKYYYNLDAIREPNKTHENRHMGIIRCWDWGYNGKYEGNKLHED
ncbi:MAG: DNA methyltransferase, partial [Gammaproteobacteria bacterium]|nr:DNA methyltransferase [Gammaproteobacteria bacterium]